MTIQSTLESIFVKKEENKQSNGWLELTRQHLKIVTRIKLVGVATSILCDSYKIKCNF